MTHTEKVAMMKEQFLALVAAGTFLRNNLERPYAGQVSISLGVLETGDFDSLIEALEINPLNIKSSLDYSNGKLVKRRSVDGSYLGLVFHAQTSSDPVTKADLRDDAFLASAGVTK